MDPPATAHQNGTGTIEIQNEFSKIKIFIGPVGLMNIGETDCTVKSPREVLSNWMADSPYIGHLFHIRL